MEPTQPDEAIDEESAAAVRRSLALVDVRAEPVWREAIAWFESEGLRPSGPRQGFDEFAHVDISGDRFTVLTVIEYSHDCRCHVEGVEDIKNFLIEGRFEDGVAIIETITQDDHEDAADETSTSS